MAPCVITELDQGAGDGIAGVAITDLDYSPMADYSLWVIRRRRGAKIITHSSPCDAHSIQQRPSYGAELSISQEFSITLWQRGRGGFQERKLHSNSWTMPPCLMSYGLLYDGISFTASCCSSSPILSPMTKVFKGLTRLWCDRIMKLIFLLRIIHDSCSPHDTTPCRCWRQPWITFMVTSLYTLDPLWRARLLLWILTVVTAWLQPAFQLSKSSVRRRWRTNLNAHLSHQYLPLARI